MQTDNIKVDLMSPSQVLRMIASKNSDQQMTDEKIIQELIQIYAKEWM